MARSPIRLASGIAFVSVNDAVFISPAEDPEGTDARHAIGG
jgi:hypothetical protein